MERIDSLQHYSRGTWVESTQNSVSSSQASSWTWFCLILSCKSTRISGPSKLTALPRIATEPRQTDLVYLRHNRIKRDPAQTCLCSSNMTEALGDAKGTVSRCSGLLPRQKHTTADSTQKYLCIVTAGSLRLQMLVLLVLYHEINEVPLVLPLSIFAVRAPN